MFENSRSERREFRSCSQEGDIREKISQVIDRLEKMEAGWRGQLASSPQVPTTETKLWSVKPDAANYLEDLVISTWSERVLEFGTSAGYSTLHLARACMLTTGCVHTIEHDPQKIRLARSMFDQCDLNYIITLHEGKIEDCMNGALSRAQFDFIFIDGAHEEYERYLKLALEHLSPTSGVIIADNVTSHAHRLDKFFERVSELEGFEVKTVPLGSGLLQIQRTQANTPHQ